MKRILFILIVCIGFARVAEASSSQMSAATLAEKCYKAVTPFSSTLGDIGRTYDVIIASTACSSYIDGVLDGNRDTEGIWCPKVAVNLGQVRDIFLRYVERHAEVKFHAAYEVVLMALAETFPCGVSTK